MEFCNLGVKNLSPFFLVHSGLKVNLTHFSINCFMSFNGYVLGVAYSQDILWSRVGACVLFICMAFVEVRGLKYCFGLCTLVSFYFSQRTFICSISVFVLSVKLKIDHSFSLYIYIF